jgi:hypothetical protein
MWEWGVDSGKQQMSKTASVVTICFVVASLSLPAVSDKKESDPTWYFAVSGDSRNCGDVVMSAIAHKVRESGAMFYWHLGDFRAIGSIDQDFAKLRPGADKNAYLNSAWPDFIERQMDPFAGLPVYLALGNHETIPPKTRNQALQQFAERLDTPSLKAQRLLDDPKDHLPKFYYHWITGGVDFITLDNATEDQFDQAQLKWFSAELKRAAQNTAVKALVVGMHEALPDSLSAGHSMNEAPLETQSGRKVYQDLVDFRKKTHKNVYVIASHSHFYMENVYNTACRKNSPESVLPGWIVGTAGAVRYRLPNDTAGAGIVKTDVYGFLLGAVSPDGTIHFEFREVKEQDVPEQTRQEYSTEFVRSCFQENKSAYVPAAPIQPPNCP